MKLNLICHFEWGEGNEADETSPYYQRENFLLFN